MQIPILAGVYTDAAAALRVAYPVNMIPVQGQDGITDGYLRPAEGIAPFATGSGSDRAAIVWNGVLYRISGTKLISVSSAGVVVVIGDVGGTGPARMDFSFDRLGILSGGFLWYYNGSVLTKVTDVNVPAALIDMVWVDGYFMVTDGAVIATSNLADPATFNPLKYGSTDEPDTIQGLFKVLNEVHVTSRNVIDVFQDVGGQFFPFNRINTALITKGSVGTHAACVFQDTLAFVGGGRNEAVSVYLGHNAQTVKISSVEVDRLLLGYTSAQLASVTMQTVLNDGAQLIYLNLPDRTLVYSALASQAAGQPVWCVLVTAIAGFAQYLAANITRAYDMWIVGSPASSAIGVWSSTDLSHYGSPVRCEINTLMLRNEGFGSILHRLELFAVVAPVVLGVKPMIATSSSQDGGQTFSMEQAVPVGTAGYPMKRLVWWRQGLARNSRIQRFRWDSTAHLSAIRLDGQFQELGV